jgi:hypothetical protein
VGLFDNNGTLVPGTLKTSPTWSGAAGSGWVSTSYDGSIIIPANLYYQVTAYVNGTIGYESVTGNPAWQNGCFYDSFALFDSGSIADLTFCTGSNANTFLVDVGVQTPSSFSVSDDFNRSDGGLGANWDPSRYTSYFSAPMAIASNKAKGPAATTALSAYFASAASDNQFAQITVATLPNFAEWVSASVRISGDGHKQYQFLGFNNGGTYQLILFRQVDGGFINYGQISWPSATAGDVLRIEAFGNNITGFLNGVPMLRAVDTDMAWGLPGIAAYGNTADSDNWSAGTVTSALNITLSSSSGYVDTYAVKTPINRSGTTSPTDAQNMRVLRPDTPNAAYAHSFLYMLPVEPGQGTTFGDPIAHMQSLGYQNAYNMTCIQPGFPFNPWYANNDTDSGIQEETFMLELVDWAKSHLATTGLEQHYLIGFSKSGVGGQRLFLKHQDVWKGVVSWDWPADEVYSTFGGDSANVYGTQANFDNNYKLTSAHLTTWKAAGDIGTKNRIWSGSWHDFQTDESDYDTLLTSLGIQHTNVAQSYTVHNWVSSPDWMGPGITFLAGLTPPPSGGLLMSAAIV